MSPRFGAAGRVAIVGYAHSPVSRLGDGPLGALTVKTVKDAVADAGLRLDQIDGFTTGAVFPSSSGQTVTDGLVTVTADWLVDQLRIQPRWLNGYQGVGQISGATVLATNAIASGSADYVVVHRAMYNPPGRYHSNPMRLAEGASQWTAPHGFWGPPAQMAMPYMEYMKRYGATREHMATVVVRAREAGSKNPWSYWFDKPITSDDYMTSRMICDPMSVLDCDIPINGVAAFVFTSAERAKDLPHRPVFVAGSAQGRALPDNGVSAWTLDAIEQGGRRVGELLWENCGFGPADVDIPQVYDAFTPFVYFWLEALGFCGPGEAFEYVQGDDVSPGITFRTGGGASGNGRMHGVPQLLECYLQLSRRAGDRQLANAEIGLACQASPNAGGVVAFTS